MNEYKQTSKRQENEMAIGQLSTVNHTHSSLCRDDIFFLLWFMVASMLHHFSSHT